MTEEQEHEQENQNQIGIEDFMAIDLRVGKVLTCEKVPKSKKLLKMEIDLGGEVRQILAGLSQFYLPEEMVGRRVVVVANLAPAKLMGLESQGMVLAASPEDGGVPTLVAAPPGEATALVRHTASGMTVPPEDPASLAQAIELLADDRPFADELGRQARESAPQFDRKKLADEMLIVLEHVAGLPPRVTTDAEEASEPGTQLGSIAPALPNNSPNAEPRPQQAS